MTDTRTEEKEITSTLLTQEQLELVRAKYKGKTMKNKGSLDGVTVDDIEVALVISNGNITKAAEFLAVNSNSLRNRINEIQRLKTFCQELREGLVDLAETELVKQVKAGNVGAIIYVLKTFGKHRGHAERALEINHNVAGIQNNAAGLIQAMRKGIGENDPHGVTIDVTPKKLEKKDA
jgi:hypothetical protein